MKRLKLMRHWYDEDRTIGLLHNAEGAPFLMTMEPGNSDHEYPRVSTGFYHCVHHASERYGQTWSLEGRDATHWRTPGIPRSTVLFHAGNWDQDTRGCILVGVDVGVLTGEIATKQSRKAMDLLRAHIGDEEFYLIIAGG